MFKAKDYVKVESLQEAYELNQKKSNIIVGGMHWLKMQNRVRMTVIDLSGLKLDTIKETEEEFQIGCMCTLRELEMNTALNSCFGNIFKECTRYIVGVQFRNGATVGGSVFGRYGFSDILTCLMALDTYVELYHGGILSLEDFCHMSHDRDILVRVIIKKDGRNVAYVSQRQTKTDFSLIACAAAKRETTWFLSVGARPSRAKLVKAEDTDEIGSLAAWTVEQLNFGTNLRGSAEYRKQLAEIYLGRLMKQIEGERA